jgi:aminoglycoside phosphotransferase
VAHGEVEVHEAGTVVAPKGVPIEKLWIVLSGHMAIRVDRGAGPRRVTEWRTGDVSGMLPYSRMTGPPEAVERLLRTRPESESLVVCHGDYCPPNVLVEEWVARGFVDLDELGTADRWWDLAVATWSITWNLGPGYEDFFLEDYGIERDDHRMEFYQLLYDVVS